MLHRAWGQENNSALVRMPQAQRDGCLQDVFCIYFQVSLKVPILLGKEQLQLLDPAEQLTASSACKVSESRNDVARRTASASPK